MPAEWIISRRYWLKTASVFIMNRYPILIPCLMLIMGTLIIQLKQYPKLDTSVWLWTGAAIAGFLAVELLTKRFMRSADPYVLPLAAFLTCIGMVMIHRLKPALYAQQVKWLLVGLIVFYLAAALSKRINELVNYKYVIGMLSLLLLIIAIVFGTEIGGSRSWIILGPIRFQPSEFAKLLMIVFLSAYLVAYKDILSAPSEKYGPLRLPPFRLIAPLVVIWGMAILMFVLQRDLGSALLFFGIAVSMTYMATGMKRYVLLAGLFFLFSSALSYFLFSHVKVRVAIWLNPWLDPNGQAYQIIQSLFAFGSGGLVGRGLTLGYPELIPEVHTDFIFSAIAEEWGLLGALAVIFAYLLLFYRGFNIALNCKNAMNALLAAGLTVSFALQAFIILAGVTKLLPLTGITLPLVSYGGSSMTASFITIGLLFALSAKENNNA